MSQANVSPVEKPTRYSSLLLLCLAAIGATGVLVFVGTPAFRLYFGTIPPLLVTTGVVFFGVAALVYLHSRQWFVIGQRKAVWRSLPLSVVLATLLVIPVIVIDVNGGFPRELNVTVPRALLFYPLMALVVEFVFHTIPLALLLGSLGSRFKASKRETVVWFCIVVVALLEPLFHMFLAPAGSAFGVTAYVGLHVFVFGMFELYLFKRYGFFSMYVFRIIYYLLWHILWGHWRLQLLF